MRKKISIAVLNLLLLVLGAVTVYPFLWMLASSFKKNSEIVALHQTFLPKLFTESCCMWGKCRGRKLLPHQHFDRRAYSSGIQERGRF